MRTLVILSDSLCIFLAFFPYKTIKIAGDLFSRHKNLQSLTPGLVDSLRKPSLVAGIIFFLISVFIFFWPQRTKDGIKVILQASLNFGARFIADTRTLIWDIWHARPGRLETILLSVIVVISAIERAMIINRPIEYDEAYTFVEFAQNSFRYIVTSYYVPNNHVLSTILIHISYLLFGNHLWSIRLPVFIASLILVLCVFFLGRALYNSKVGLSASVIVAFLPTMILRSVSARGYIFVALAAILGFLVADYVIRNKNISAWFFLIVTCALGFYANPVMLYPCGMLFVWLLLAGITREVSIEYIKLAAWLKYLFFAGISIFVLTMVFYSPILLTNDLRQIYIDNRVLQPNSLNGFIASVPATLRDINQWSKGVVGPILDVLWVGLLLSFLFHGKYSKSRVPTQIYLIVSIIIMALIERPASINYVWIWLIPFLALWCAAGIVGGLHWVAQRLSPQYIPSLALAILLLGFAVNGMYQSYNMAALHPVTNDPAAEKVTLFLKPLLTDSDFVVVSECSDARYWYYFQYYGIPESVIRNRNRFFTKTYVIVYTQANPYCGNEKMADVFAQYGPDAVFFDLNTARIIKQIDYATVYELDPILERVQKAYPNH
ncbi:MAG: glycosyltransferase family 39 protein [Anaerolineales bacterium]